MRTIFSIIALFSLCTLQAQEYTPSYGRELPRGEVIAYPTAAEATTANRSENRYLTQLSQWTQQKNSFSTSFVVPFAWANRQVIFHLGGASGNYEVRVNGRTAAYNNNGNSPADFNITREVAEGMNNIEIVLSKPASATQLESWKNSDMATMGVAYVMSQPTMRVRDVLTKTWQSDSTAMAEIGIVVRSNSLNPRTSRIHYELLEPGGRTAAAGHKQMTLDMRREDTLRFLVSVPANLLWSTELPTQYTLRVKTQYEGRDAEHLEFKLGFRVLEYTPQGTISVNGTPATLHVKEVSPWITPNDIARLREQGYNTLKLQPGYVPQSLFTACNEQGVYLIMQAPIDTRSSGNSRRRGGNPSNDPTWLGAYIERTEDSYHTAKRHPSVIAFSLAEKSANGINLYESYLNMKRLEDNRPILYLDAAGEWNTDKLDMSFSTKGKND